MGWKRDGRGNIQKCRATAHWNSDVGKGLRKRCEATNVPDIDVHFTEPKPNSIVRVPDINT